MEAAVVSGILKIVINKLAPLLSKEYSLIVGVQKHLIELKDLVEEVISRLEEVGGQVSPNTPEFNWLRKLKDIAYDVDDIVDEFQLKAEEHDAHDVAGVMSRYMCEIPKSFILQCKAAKKLKGVKKRFEAIAKQRNEFNAIVDSLLGYHARNMNHSIANRTTLPVVDVESVLGRDQEKHQIISKLVDNQHIIKTVSIIGLGGSGKTTLAKLVFNDFSIVEKHFEVRLWVHVSQESDEDKLIKKLFESFADDNPSQYTLPSMSRKILEKLTGKRFLLVLDDVWTDSRSQWDKLMEHLKSGARGSRILLTTRSGTVAETMGSIDRFDLPFLSPDDSWQLFQQSLGIPAEGLEMEFVEVGKEIVKKCGGVPLAIKTLAGVLQGKGHIQEWKSMRDSNVLDAEGKEGIVSACLRLSYLNLPSHLKQCFTICSLFPKGHKIDKEKLIDQWIALGMITTEDGVDYMEYTGQKYFNYLVQISFLQDVAESVFGRVECRMHDLVHDLARSIIHDEISLLEPKEATSSARRYRYFSIAENSRILPSSNFSFRRTRAMYVGKGNEFVFSKKLKNARHLRTITVKFDPSKSVPTAILQIKHLKYLSISGTSCESLPKTISEIWNLQALHLTDMFSLCELPISIGRLQKLRSLNLKGCTHLTTSPDSISNCHMLSSLDLSSCNSIRQLPNSIDRNKNLRVLRLQSTGIHRLPSSIIALENLERLDLNLYLVELPEGVGNLNKLEVLNLTECCILVGMPVGIGKLSRLQQLDLFVVGGDKKFAQISELGNLARISGELTIRNIRCVIDPDDAYKACLNQKTNLQMLKLFWGRETDGANTEKELAVIDGLEPPSEIKVLEIEEYGGEQYPWWMKQVSNRVQQLPQFPCLTVLRLKGFPNLKHLDGLVELPFLEELKLSTMPSLETFSGGPFPSLIKLRMMRLSSLREVWMVTERAMLGDGGDCNNYCHMGQMQIGSQLSDLKIKLCPKLIVNPYLPLSLERLCLETSNEQLLSKSKQGQTPCSSFSAEGLQLSFTFSHLKNLQLTTMAERGSQHGWELLQHMTALETLSISWCYWTELPESMRSLTSLRSLKLAGCSFLCVLPEWLGELRSLQDITIHDHCQRLTSLSSSMHHLTNLQSLHIGGCSVLLQLPERLGDLRFLHTLRIDGCPGLSSFPPSLQDLTSLQELVISNCQSLTLPECLGKLHSLRILRIEDLPCLTCLPESVCRLTSLEELTIKNCPGIKSLPDGMKDLTALQDLFIMYCPDLVRRCKRGNGEDWHLISHIPSLLFL